LRIFDGTGRLCHGFVIPCVRLLNMDR
jgi:hypothetical protein